MIRRMYLLLYNCLQFLGWSYNLFVFLRYVLNHQTYVGVWPQVGACLQLVQLLQFLELAHAYLKLVPSSIVETGIQVTARNLVVWLVISKVPESSLSIGFPMLFLTWSSAEISRFAFYALKLLNFQPYFVTWARYTFFLWNYPIGSLGEILVVLAAIPNIKRRKILTLELPNALNTSFHFDYFLMTTLGLSVYILPRLFGHMLKQRKKVLG